MQLIISPPFAKTTALEMVFNTMQSMIKPPFARTFLFHNDFPGILKYLGEKSEEEGDDTK